MPDFVRIRPVWVRCWPKYTDSSLGPSLVSFGQISTNLVLCLPSLADVGRSRTDVVLIWLSSARMWSGTEQIWAGFVKNLGRRFCYGRGGRGGSASIRQGGMLGSAVHGCNARRHRRGDEKADSYGPKVMRPWCHVDAKTGGRASRETGRHPTCPAMLRAPSQYVFCRA